MFWTAAVSSAIIIPQKISSEYSNCLSKLSSVICKRTVMSCRLVVQCFPGMVVEPNVANKIRELYVTRVKVNGIVSK